MRFGLQKIEGVIRNDDRMKASVKAESAHIHLDEVAMWIILEPCCIEGKRTKIDADNSSFWRR